MKREPCACGCEQFPKSKKAKFCAGHSMQSSKQAVDVAETVAEVRENLPIKQFETDVTNEVLPFHKKKVVVVVSKAEEEQRKAAACALRQLKSERNFYFIKH